MSEPYNGWSNRETWLVNLWLSNEEPSYRGTVEMARECWASAEADQTFTRDEVARAAMAERLKDDFEEANPLGEQANVWSDLLGTALAAVDWHEIARSWIDGLSPEERS